MGETPYQVVKWETAQGAAVTAMVPPGRSLSDQQRADLSAQADKMQLIDPDGIFHFTVRFHDAPPA